MCSARVEGTFQVGQKVKKPGFSSEFGYYTEVIEIKVHRNIHLTKALITSSFLLQSCTHINLGRLFVLASHSCRSFGLLERSPESIAKGKDLPVIVNIVRMMHGMIFTAHNFPDIEIHGVMNISGPDSREKQHGHMRHIMTGRNR